MMWEAAAVRTVGLDQSFLGLEMRMKSFASAIRAGVLEIQTKDTQSQQYARNSLSFLLVVN